MLLSSRKGLEMNNKTNIEEDIKILKTFKTRYKTINYNRISLEDVQAIENILAHIERLEKEKEIHIKLEQQYKKEYLDEKAKYDSLVEKIEEEKERTINEGKADREKHTEDVMFRQGYCMALEELLDTKEV